MQEKIGNVTLDYEYYPGEDLYSDGPVEEELLEALYYTSLPDREKILQIEDMLTLMEIEKTPGQKTAARRQNAAA